MSNPFEKINQKKAAIPQQAETKEGTKNPLGAGRMKRENLVRFHIKMDRAILAKLKKDCTEAGKIGIYSDKSAIIRFAIKKMYEAVPPEGVVIWMRKQGFK